MGNLLNNGSIDFGKVNRKQVSFKAESPAEKRRRSIAKTIEMDGGRYVSFGDGEGCGILVAGVEEAGKQYFAYIGKDRTIEYKDAGTKYHRLRDIPSDLSVLHYLWTREHDTVYEMAVNQLNGKKLITPLGIKTREELARLAKQNRK